MGKTYELDRKLIHPKHKWVFDHVVETDGGVGVWFYCSNPGCQSRRGIPVYPEENESICFNAAQAVRIDNEIGHENGNS